MTDTMLITPEMADWCVNKVKELEAELQESFSYRNALYEDYVNLEAEVERLKDLLSCAHHELYDGKCKCKDCWSPGL